jgi:hypothetical protein
MKPFETICEGGEAKDSRAKARALAYDGNRKEMVWFRSISSSPNERKFFGGNNILQIKRKESVRHIIERMHNIDASEQLIHTQATSLNISW